MGLKIKTDAAAKLLGVKSSTLRNWRCEKKGPPWIQYGPQTVVYDEDDIQTYVAAHYRVPSVRACLGDAHGAV